MSDSGSIDPGLIRRIVGYAAGRDAPVASLSVDEIADGLGMSRSSLYRRIGSRQALHEAIREAGHETGEQPNATERMVEAAAALIREGGVQALTLDAVANRAEVALPTVFARFGNRVGLLVNVFERHGPVPRIERHLVPLERGDSAGFRRCVTEIYGELWDLLMAEYALVSAMVAEVLREPEGEIRRFLERRYLPQIFSRILPWLQEQVDNGLVRPVPLLLLGQQFVAPMVMHMATRPLVQSTGIAPLPQRDEACALFADLYCSAVLAREHPDGGSQ
jgi:AcrR family transcriptional regulator